MTTPNRVLIIDMLNLFLRNYIVNPMLTPNGEPNGGFYGSLRSMQKMIRETSPELVLAIWDGPGAAARKRKTHKGYKEGRKPVKKNYNVPGMSESDEQENRYDQQLKLIDFLGNCPVSQIMINEVEADDVIAYICRVVMRGKDKVIVSNDQDFLQLLDGNTIQFFPARDKYYTKDMVVEEYRIHPKNFVIARAMAGDKSDNIAGLPRVGIKTVANRFEFLKDDEDHTIDEVIDYARKTDSKLSVYKKVLENDAMIRDNYNIMQLYAPNISAQAARRIDYAIKEFDYGLSMVEVDKVLLKDGIDASSLGEIVKYFRVINNLKKKNV